MLSSADGAKGRCPLDSRPGEGRPPAQRAALCGRHQRALPSGLPLGSLTPDPEMHSHLLFRLRAGRGLGAEMFDDALLTGPPERLRAGRFSAQKRGGASCFILGFMV